jgi:hypothetical protein
VVQRAIFLLALAASASAQTAKIDYADGKTWLCRPGRTDACAVDLTTTIVAGDGTLKREEWKANPNAPIDCFYVYPTVSLDNGGNSDMERAGKRTASCACSSRRSHRSARCTRRCTGRRR